MEEKDKLLDHNYDGIQELDNSLPPWWLYLFYLTIIWAIGYFVYYHVLGIGDSQIEAYNKEMGIESVQSAEKSSFIYEYKSPYSKTPDYYKKQKPVEHSEDVAMNDEEEKEEAVEEQVDYKPVTDPARLQNGAQVFTTNCVACHGNHGEGGIGPNLTDNYWINGDGSFNAIVKVIQDGVPAKGMITWKPLLKPEDLLDVASHVYKLRGTHPANAKAPQGEKYGD